MPDIIGLFIGFAALLTLYYLFKYSDDFSDGNIEKIHNEPEDIVKRVLLRVKSDWK